MSKGEYQQATMDDDETTYILNGRKTHRAKTQHTSVEGARKRPRTTGASTNPHLRL